MKSAHRQKLLDRCSEAAKRWIGKTITEETAAELAHAFYVEARTEWEARQHDFQKLYLKKSYAEKALNGLEQRRQEREFLRKAVAAEERRDAGHGFASAASLIVQTARTIEGMRDFSLARCGRSASSCRSHIESQAHGARA